VVNNKNHRKGKYIPINKSKYVGDINNIVTRSSWEYGCCRYFDLNPDVEFWGSETAKIKYRCGTDNQLHTYMIDFTVKYKDGRILLIEVKPANQTTLPKASKGKSKSTVLTETLAFIKNKSKWIVAHKYAEENGAKFVIWTENYLKKIGIPCN
jgi:hypothetical protein